MFDTESEIVNYVIHAAFSSHESIDINRGLTSEEKLIMKFYVASYIFCRKDSLQEQIHSRFNGAQFTYELMDSTIATAELYIELADEPEQSDYTTRIIELDA